MCQHPTVAPSYLFISETFGTSWQSTPMSLIRINSQEKKSGFDWPFIFQLRRNPNPRPDKIWQWWVWSCSDGIDVDSGAERSLHLCLGDDDDGWWWWWEVPATCVTPHSHWSAKHKEDTLVGEWSLSKPGKEHINAFDHPGKRMGRWALSPERFDLLLEFGWWWW